MMKIYRLSLKKIDDSFNEIQSAIDLVSLKNLAYKECQNIKIAIDEIRKDFDFFT